MPEADETPDRIAEAVPKFTRSFDEMNTGSMVFELQGSVGELKESIASLTRLVEKGFNKIDIIERSNLEIKEALRLLLLTWGHRR